MDSILKDQRVLIVDDTAVQRVLLNEILRGSGAALTEAASGEEALALAGSREFDAFLLDIRLTDMNGIELCRALRAMDRYRCTPIIFITAIEERELLQWALEAGADDFIQKPVHGVVLRRRLANLLQRAAHVSQVAAPTPRVPLPRHPFGELRYLRLYSDEAGVSRFSDEVMRFLPSGWGKDDPIERWTMYAAPGEVCGISRIAAGYSSDWHPARRRQFVMVASGVMTIEAGSGELRRLVSGMLLLAEDLTGPGHRLRAEADGDLLLFTVPAA